MGAYSIKKKTPPPTKKRSGKPKNYQAFKKDHSPKPKKHDHAGHMIWDDDYCACRVCEQAWNMTSSGWKFVQLKS